MNGSLRPLRLDAALPLARSSVKLLACFMLLFIASLPISAQRSDHDEDRKVPCDCDLQRAALKNAEAALAAANEAFEEAGAALADAEIERDQAAEEVNEIVNSLTEINGVVTDPADLPEGSQVGRFGLSGFGIDATVYFPAGQSSSVISQITDRLEEDGVADAIDRARDASRDFDKAQDDFDAAEAERVEAQETLNMAQRDLDDCLRDC